MYDKIAHWLPETDLRSGHKGLAEVAKKKLKMDVESLQSNEFILFINRAWTAFKMYRGGSRNVILHYRCNDGDKLNPKAVMAAPKYALGSEIGYKPALVQIIRADFAKRYPSEGEAYG